MPPTDSSALLPLVRRIIDDIVYASMATVGPDLRPRSRIVHPVWEWEAPGGPVGWVTSRPTPVKQRHVAASPFASFLYWSPTHDVVTVDAEVRWHHDDAERLDVWERIAAAPPPVGFDPALIFPDGPAAPDYAVLVARPFRLTARTGAASSGLSRGFEGFRGTRYGRWGWSCCWSCRRG